MYKLNIKRYIDIIFAIAVLPIIFIFLIPISICIFLDDKGPIFFNGKRLGHKMKPFNMYKFRTMKVNAEDIRNSDGSTFNNDNDPRVTNVGKFLRKSSIDELPQFINVFKGSMTLVGPRPSPLGNKDKYPEYYFKKFDVKPGITGLNQALLRNSASMEQRMRLDVYYAENISWKMDAYIIFKTITSVLKQSNINQKRKSNV